MIVAALSRAETPAPPAYDPLDRLCGVLGRITARIDRANAEYAAIAAESRAALARLEAMEHVNPLAHLVTGGFHAQS